MEGKRGQLIPLTDRQKHARLISKAVAAGARQDKACEVIGLSKFNRIVHHIAERPQIQEEMTTQIADELKKYAKTENLAVVVKAEHHCMTHRGVREHESDMTTAIMLGAFKEDPATRDEFYKICMSMKGHG